LKTLQKIGCGFALWLSYSTFVFFLDVSLRAAGLSERTNVTVCLAVSAVLGYTMAKIFRSPARRPKEDP